MVAVAAVCGETTLEVVREKFNRSAAQALSRQWRVSMSAAHTF